MFRLGYLASAAAALALAANLAFTAPAAAHDSGGDAARALAGLIALGIIVKSLDDRKHRHYSHNKGYYPRTYYPRSYYKPYGGRHHAKHHRHHYRGIHRHRTRHGGYYRHSH
ncbi:hypothetical protein KUW17_03620 [Leisingera aquaemixtae]|uniref:hypothetical protein n=1 Tax=Leisingera aquaemixtae TaxID=1396826 RepID=UPI001C976018|nr:hypothetical protein [Leisingera aquaemixtae]MBY6065813.1 hypothetical protein [Leisingera aquaemixtae]